MRTVTCWMGIISALYSVDARAEIDSLKSQLIEIIRKEESRNIGFGFRRLHGTEAHGLAQALPSSHCDAWVQAVRGPLQTVKLQKGQQARISEIITDWNGPGGRHNLYVGFLKEGSRVTHFAFDPWQHERALQFRILKPDPKSGTIKMGSAEIKYDPVSEILFYEKAPTGIPETRIVTGSEIDASGNSIELLGEGAPKLKSLALRDAVCAGAESARSYLGHEQFEKMRARRCGSNAQKPLQCSTDRRVISQQGDLDRFLQIIHSSLKKK